MSLPKDVGGTEIHWPTEAIVTGKGKPASPARIGTVAAILEAYGVLSSLPIEDRAKLINDILGIPDTDA